MGESEGNAGLFFPGKPDEATRTRLKRQGFRWTPSLGCWQAYRNGSSLYNARLEAGLPEQELQTSVHEYAST